MRTRHRMLACFAAVLSLPVAASAQTSSVGRIERVADVVGGGEPVEVRGASDRVQLRRGATGSWVVVPPETVLLERDRLRVRRYVDVRMRVDRPTQRGRLVFLAELLRPDGGRVFEVGGAAQQSDYVLGDTLGGGELTVVVESGALVVNWSAGRLNVHAAGIRTVITGTRLAVVMDSTGDTGALFLEEGSVAFPDFPAVVVSPGDMVQLRRGFPPVVTAIAAAQAESARQAMRYNGEQVWASFTPFWRKPGFLVPAVAAVGGIATYLVTQSGEDSGRLRGTVIVRIPF